MLLALPLGELSPQVTERAHAVSPVTKVSNATRNFSVIAKSSPFGGAGTPSGVTERVQPVESLQKTFPQRRAFAESGAANAVSETTPSVKACGFATFPKGTASVVAAKFSASPKGVPLGELAPQATEGVAPLYNEN